VKIVNAVAWAAVALGILGAASPAHAFSALSEDNGAVRAKPGAAPQRFRALTVLVSPYTSFQRNFAVPGEGVIFQEKKTNVGPLILIEKLYRLDQRDTFQGAHPRSGSTFTLGGYYWYNSKKTDRLTIYGKYFPNRQFGVEADIGGETRQGITEYYAFLLYNALHATAKNNLAIQVGIGPYIPRTSIGDVGYTGTVTAAYKIVHRT
jgi:hypothetical protein